jgi:phosphoribosylamine--glycine ligase
MIHADGTPNVLEFNCRFGDPETQPIMMRMRSDLPALCLAALDGRLDETAVEWDPRVALGVVMAAGGYPGAYEKGKPISGLERFDGIEDVKVFHAGTAEADGRVVTSGGRVLCAVALADDVAGAQTKAYEVVRGIRFDGAFYRSDIGYRALGRG